MSDLNFIYFKANSELLDFYRDLNNRVKEYSEKSTALAKSVGGKAAVSSQGRMVGVHFPDGAPENWKKLDHTKSWDRFFRPLISKSQELREFHKKMSELKRPEWSDVLSKLNLSGHMIIGSPAPGQRGFPMHYAEGESIGENLIVKVPVGKSSAGSDDKPDEYAGHEWLTRISEADYLQLKADEARQKESVA